MLKVKPNNETGSIAIEYIVCLVLITVGLVGTLRLTVTGVQNGRFAETLSDTNDFATLKASELARDKESLLTAIPTGSVETSVGSIAPDPPTTGYFDLLNNQGMVTTNMSGGRVVRQWMIVKNKPFMGDFEVYVSLVNRETSKVTRVAKYVVTDGQLISEGAGINIDLPPVDPPAGDPPIDPPPPIDIPPFEIPPYDDPPYDIPPIDISPFDLPPPPHDEPPTPVEELIAPNSTFIPADSSSPVGGRR